MKYKVFDVIETMDGKKGTIIEICENKTYKINFDTSSKSRVTKIEEKEILKIIYKSKDVADKN